MKEQGLIAYCDYLNDDQPYLIHTGHGPIVCVPYSNDINDFNLFARGGMSAAAGLETLKTCFDQLYGEGARTGRIMNVGLHPHVIGQAHRIGALREFVEYAASATKFGFPAARRSRRGTCKSTRATSRALPRRENNWRADRPAKGALACKPTATITHRSFAENLSNGRTMRASP